MAKKWVKGMEFDRKGGRVVVTSVIGDVVTLSYAKGSGKTGWAGSFSTKPTADTKFNAKRDEYLESAVEPDSDVHTLEDYENYVAPEGLSIGDTIVTHSSGNVGVIERIDDKFISSEYLQKHFPDFNGEYVGYAVNYDTEFTNREGIKSVDNRWTTVVELTEAGITRRYVLEHDEATGEDTPREI